MEGVPLRTPAALQEVHEDVTLTVPDFLTTMQDTQYEFSLENWVLTGLQSGFSCPPQRQACTSSSGPPPSCPPYWMMLSGPQPRPRQRSHSLSSAPPCGQRPEQEGEGGGAPTARSGGEEHAICSPLALRKGQRSFVPNLLNPPACLSSLPHQRRKNLRHRSLSERHVCTPHDATAQLRSPDPKGHRPPDPKGQRPPDPSDSTAHKITTRAGSGGCAAPWDLGAAGLDSAELLSALSPEERVLLEDLVDRGYPLHMAVLALQKTGHQSPDKVLSYLVACDHLCQLGYSMAQVEEALEMFQNCETKAEEFLQLLSQFNEMGFQQNTIKEVLLVHENHRERALEELMTRVA
ncbi:unnamed protein product [Ophioblennius macclurei]